MRLFLVRLLVLVVIAVPLHAQDVPGFSAEFIGGGARHTDRTSHTYYKSGGATFLTVGGTVRLWKPGPIAPVLTYEYSAGCGLGCGDDAVCRLAPDNSCFQDFDDPKGTALALGVSGNLRGHLIGTIAVGKAWYLRKATYVDANVALPLFSHFAVVADARRIVTTDARGDHVWLVPISFGFRLQ